MQIIRVKTPRGLELKGAMWGDNSMDSVVIMMSGIMSNVFQNDLLTATGNLLEREGIAYIVGHAMDAFSCIGYSDFSTGKQVYTGVVFDDFSLSYEDVASYVRYAKSLGFKKIILAGHSLGSNRIIHYLGTNKENLVDNFIVSAPIDLEHWIKVMPNVEDAISLAKNLMSNGKGEEILPFLFGGFSPMSANAVLSFINADNLKNCPVISDKGELESLAHIAIQGSFIIGEKDSLTDNDPKGFMERINAHTKSKDSNTILVIPEASHIFYNKHKEYAEAVLECVRRFGA